MLMKHDTYLEFYIDSILKKKGSTDSMGNLLITVFLMIPQPKAYGKTEIE